MNTTSLPQVAPGVELLGEYQGGGFKTPRYLARRADGQLLQLTELLHLVVSHTDGTRDAGAIAQLVTRDYGRPVSPDNVDYLISEKLMPMGLVTRGPIAQTTAPRAAPAFALNMRRAFVPARLVNAMSWLIQPLFLPFVVVVVIATLIGFDVWLFAVHGIAPGIRALLYQPSLIVVVFGLIVLSALFHELGHATACRYGGARPGAIGAGLYLVWPAFYTDVTDSYRLDRAGRLRTDLGGIYFNAIFILGTAAVYFATGQEILLVVIAVQHLEVARQFIPFLRLDGYYVISDLTGVPDLFARVKPILRNAFVRKKDPQVAELKPWTRLVVTAWVFVTIPAIILIYAFLVIRSPQIMATAADSLEMQWGGVRAAIDAGLPGDAALAGANALALLLPAAGLAIGLGRSGLRAGHASWTWIAARPQARVAFASLGIVGAGIVSTQLWTQGTYQPITEGERWTVDEQFGAIAGPDAIESAARDDETLAALDGSIDLSDDEMSGKYLSGTEAAGADPDETATTSPTPEATDEEVVATSKRRSSASPSASPTPTPSPTQSNSEPSGSPSPTP